MKIYLIGSLRNSGVPVLAQKLRGLGYDVFDDWYAAGPEADDRWREYEEARGHSYTEALAGHAANHVFGYDQKHLDESDLAVLLLPAGRSGHLEFGYIIGQGKPGHILLPPDSDRWDVMYRFATQVHTTEASLLAALTRTEPNEHDRSCIRPGTTTSGPCIKVYPAPPGLHTYYWAVKRPVSRPAPTQEEQAPLRQGPGDPGHQCPCQCGC